MSSRSALEADLLHHQAAGDLAAQAETLMALAQTAIDDMDFYEQSSYGLAQGLYGQAWTVYEHIGDQIGVLQAMYRLGLLWVHIEQTSRGGATGINLALWFSNLLAHSLVVGNRQNQAEIYIAIAQHILRNVHTLQTLDAYILGFASYRMIGSVPGHVKTPNILSNHFGSMFGNTSPRQRHFQDVRAESLLPYQRVNDQSAVAHILLAYGETAFWQKAYDIARADLEAARQIFQMLNDTENLIYTLRRMMRLAYRIHDYDLYKVCHEALISWLRAQGETDELLSSWLELAAIATDYQDWATARQAYQSGLLVAAMTNVSSQGRIYWQWGQMEYHKGRNSMGIALCQWAIVLIEHYELNQSANYQRELKQMRIGIMP